MIAPPLESAKFWRLSLLGAASFIALWTVAALSGITSRTFLPAPWEVMQRFAQLLVVPFAGHVLHEHVLASLQRFLMGFVLAVLVGIPLGLLMARFKWADRVVSPVFEAVRFVAPIAWVPFAALWFGTGIGGPTLIIFAGAFPPCLINAYRGSRSVDVRFLEAASMLGVGSFKTITEVLFPAAVPSIIAGLRIGAGLGWMSLVGAELIVASSGMGNLIVRAQSALATDTVMAGMVAIGMVGIVIDVLLRRLERQLLKHRNA